MSVRPHPTKKNAWVIDYYPEGRHGKRVRKVVTGISWEAAKRIEQTLRQQHRLKASLSSRHTIEEILPDYLAWCSIHRSPRTKQDLEYSLRFLLPIFGPLAPSEIMPMHILKFKQERIKDGASNRTINKQLDYLSGIITWMVKNGLAQPLPFKIEKLPYERPLPKSPPRQDVEAFLREIRDPIKKALILLMAQSGLRFSEATHVRWENISWEEDTIILKRTKGRRPRVAILPPHVKEILWPMRQSHGYVFVNPKTGKPFTTLKTIFRLASKRAGLATPLTPHMLRHFFATDLLSRSRDLRLVQVALGHQSVTTTEIYTKITVDRLRDEVLRRSHDYTDKNS